MNNFENRDGQLSQYAFKCGYIQEKYTDKLHVMLFQDGVWHVKAWDIDNAYNRKTWECFDSLTRARKYYRTLN